jgi:hypothetical protein
MHNGTTPCHPRLRMTWPPSTHDGRVLNLLCDAFGRTAHDPNAACSCRTTRLGSTVRHVCRIITTNFCMHGLTSSTRLDSKQHNTHTLNCRHADPLNVHALRANLGRSTLSHTCTQSTGNTNLLASLITHTLVITL